MERLPAAARGIARTAVLRWCTERGHSVVSSGDVDQPRDPPGLDRKDIRIVAGGGRRRACLAAASYVSGSKGIDAGTERKIRQGAWLVISFTSQLFSSPDDK